MINWTSVAGIVLAIVAYFVTGWVDSLIILAVLAMFIGWTVSPKVFMCATYHTIIFGLIGYITMTVWVPLIDDPWYYIDWLRIFLIGLTVASLLVGLGLSIASCFTSKALTATEIGQWTFSEWMPQWGSNIQNKWYGVFTGLPASMVKIKALDGISKTVTEKKPIQIEIEGDPNRNKFEAVFDFNFKWKIICTHVFITNKNEVKDLINLILKALTSYLNDPTHNYKEISKLKLEIRDIQDHIERQLGESIRLYGVEITNFRLVDIELPQKIIDQQNNDAAAKRAQEQADIRELMDTEAFKKQLKEMKIDNPDLTDKQAVDAVLTLRGIVKSINIKGGGRGGVITRV
jgi:hypothetical protein